MKADPFNNVAEVTERLEEEYPSSNLGNKERPFDELVYTVLANRTREEYYQRAFGRVKDLVKDWNQLPDVEDEDLAAAIGDAGLGRKKARTLKHAASLLQNDMDEVSLDFLENMSTEDAEDYLLRIRGVGPKTVKCVLMYALDRTVFPVDTNCARVGNRTGWLESSARRYTKAQMHRIEERVPSRLRRSLHIRLVQHGRRTCTDGKPHCDSCPLNDLCDYYEANR
ncbi:endonuclease III [Salinibacter ruber]|uniref:endonuclease III domain-containing protein n=1 Tax=Salinibacter ruber TaxID=146919 RepID=UPI00245187DC|nr:endonuclease III [Salinibacter ruber]MCS3712525.1 endonuclease III [Salinibacter ruber]